MDLQMESEGISTKNNEHGTSDGLDYILKQLDLMSELIDQMEGKFAMLQVLFVSIIQSVLVTVGPNPNLIFQQYCKITLIIYSLK